MKKRKSATFRLLIASQWLEKRLEESSLEVGTGKIFNIKNNYPFSIEFRENLCRMAKNIQWVYKNQNTGEVVTRIPPNTPDFSFDKIDKNS